jgi:hypothetical protein
MRIRGPPISLVLPLTKETLILFDAEPNKPGLDAAPAWHRWTFLLTKKPNPASIKAHNRRSRYFPSDRRRRRIHPSPSPRNSRRRTAAAPAMSVSTPPPPPPRLPCRPSFSPRISNSLQFRPLPIADLRVQWVRRGGDGGEELLRDCQRPAARRAASDHRDRLPEGVQDPRQALHRPLRARHRRPDAVSRSCRILPARPHGLFSSVQLLRVLGPSAGTSGWSSGTSCISCARRGT